MPAPSLSAPSPIEPPYGPTLDGSAADGAFAQSESPSTLRPRAASSAGSAYPMSQLAIIATAPLETSDAAFRPALPALVGSDFESHHLTSILLPRTPPAALISPMCVVNASPACTS